MSEPILDSLKETDRLIRHTTSEGHTLSKNSNFVAEGKKRLGSNYPTVLPSERETLQITGSPKSDLEKSPEISWQFKFPQLSDRLVLLGNPTCQLLTRIAEQHERKTTKLRENIMELNVDFKKLTELCWLGGNVDTFTREKHFQLFSADQVFKYEQDVRSRLQDSLGLNFDANDSRARSSHLAQVFIEWADWKDTRNRCLTGEGLAENLTWYYVHASSFGINYAQNYRAVCDSHNLNKFVISVMHKPISADKNLEWAEILSLLLADANILSECLRFLDNDIDKFLDISCRRRGMLRNKYTTVWIHALVDHLSTLDMKLQFTFKQKIRESFVQNKLSGGATVAFHLQETEHLLELYNEDLLELCKFLEIQDKKGNTALHVNSKSIQPALVRLYNERVVPTEFLRHLLGIQNESKKSSADLTKESAWLLHQITVNNFALYEKPTVLLIYRTTHRPGALEEAGRITSLFSSLGMEPVISENLTESAIHSQLAEAAGNTKSALIVFIMTHGSVGTITDRDGKHIKLSDVEMFMSQTLYPKLLITQCCQNDNLSNNTDGDQGNGSAHTSHDSAGRSMKDRPVFAPRHEDMCIVMSCVQGQYSKRDLFVKVFSDKLKCVKKDQGIGKLVQETGDEMKRQGSDQIPLIQSTFRRELCLANCFHLQK